MATNVTVEIEAEEMDEGLSLMEDLKSGGLNISRHTKMPGRVKIVGFIKKRTVEENFDLLDLEQAKAGLAQYNPFVLNKTIAEAYEAVVDVLGESGLMVIADNHMSQPRWCCSLDDGNGFFGDRYFDPQEWLQGLSLVAQRFSKKPTMVGMSLRNEIRGTNENANDWNNYVTQGVTTIHNINPNVLVIVSGLNFDNDLRCLKEKPLNASALDNKLVFEVHLYSFSGDAETNMGTIRERLTMQKIGS
ncbi:uncharacterized protein LOC111474045 [Cucurbita maxima]|uniref:Uncharacterized protein LOC111474045 n=1 Tax=Cucurbita maxima TaxID=3661 RepID=A0A6J1II75_CUCMA|nr:uncharacterized protein LOC111474045 [Cucurbita maxima]